jgi:hypothetical protein
MEKVKDDNCVFYLDRERKRITVEGETLRYSAMYDVDMFQTLEKDIRASLYTVFLARRKLLRTYAEDEILVQFPTGWKPAKKK